MENIVLKGTAEEQAKQLWDTLKNKHIDAEELKELVPVTNDFFRALTEVMVREIESENSMYKKFHYNMQNIIIVCNTALADGNVTKEERIEIYKLLAKLSELMAEVTTNRGGETTKRIGFLSLCVTSIAALIAYLTGKTSIGKNGGVRKA